MAHQKRLTVGLAITGVVIAVIGLFYVIGAYSRNRRVELEKVERERFAELEAAFPNLDGIRKLPVLYKERAQPLDSVARSLVRELSGRREIYGVDPVLVLLSWSFDDEPAFPWRDIPYFNVSHLLNKETLGVDAAHSMASWNQVMKNPAVDARIAGFRDVAMEHPRDLARRDEELWRLRMSYAPLLASHLQHLYRIIPPWEAQKLSDSAGQDDWHVPVKADMSGHDREAGEAARTAFAELGAAWRNRDAKAFDSAADRLIASTAALNPAAMLSDDDVKAELFFNSFKPILWAQVLCFITAILALYGLALHMAWLRWLSIVSGFAAIAFLGLTFYLRTTLGFHVTITNLYESMVAVAAGSMLITVLVEVVRRRGMALIAGGFGAFVVLTILDTFSVKFDDGIGGTIAVLANNVWVHIHVPIVMTAYAGFFIAFLLSCVALPWTLKDPRGVNPSLRDLLRTTDIFVNLGTLLMFCGTILGGVWAHVSWGRFWGWDPKENAALALVVFYTILIHGRFTKWMNAFWSSLWVFVGGNVLLWAYYGTNELSGGFHSYANSAGGAGFWENLVHERNRWFVVTTLVLAGLTALALVVNMLRQGAPAPAADEVASDDDGTVPVPGGQS